MKKGQLQAMGPLIAVAVAVLIGLAIFSGSVAPSVGVMTQTKNLVNSTVTMPAAGSYVDLTGQEYVSGVVVTNATGGTVVATTNYSIVEMNSPTTGVKTIRLLAASGPYNSKSVNVSYVYGDVGYVDDSGGRAIVNLIPIMVAVALLGAVFLAIRYDWFD